jgi:hypothetical protein
MPRHRLPTIIAEARGYLKHPERRRARASEPERTGEDLRLSQPDRDLSREQKAIWHEIAQQLHEGVTGASDRLAFRKLVCLESKSRREQTKGNEEQLIRAYLRDFGYDTGGQKPSRSDEARAREGRSVGAAGVEATAIDFSLFRFPQRRRPSTERCLVWQMPWE